MFYLRVESDFASAHQLRGYKGKCENLHGHNWRVMVRVCRDKLDDLGMVMDFTDVKKLLKRHMEYLDHQFLNHIAPFDAVNPTSENIAMFLYDELGRDLPEGVRVHDVTVWESEKCAATYDGPGRT
jgi:6-pyruvoyltetrahydropterin/6-carboxytetrahydropterin synthase